MPCIETPCLTTTAAYQEYLIPIEKNSSEIRTRIYSGGHESDQPGILFLHGGFFNSGTTEDADELCKGLMNSAVVVSIAYPLAPKAVFPRAIEAVYEVLEWIADHARQLNIDPLRLFIGGHQAGGNMAVAVTMMARDRLFNRPRKRKLAGQILLSPMLDPMLTSHSLMEMSSSLYRQGWNDYLSFSSDFQHPYAGPFWSRRLVNLPRALLITFDSDPFQDETNCFASKLFSAGTEAHFHMGQGDHRSDEGARDIRLANYLPLIKKLLLTS